MRGGQENLERTGTQDVGRTGELGENLNGRQKNFGRTGNLL